METNLRAIGLSLTAVGVSIAGFGFASRENERFIAVGAFVAIVGVAFTVLAILWAIVPVWRSRTAFKIIGPVLQLPVVVSHENRDVVQVTLRFTRSIPLHGLAAWIVTADRVGTPPADELRVYKLRTSRSLQSVPRFTGLAKYRGDELDVFVEIVRTVAWRDRLSFRLNLGTHPFGGTRDVLLDGSSNNWWDSLLRR